ncbi:hypothetical protein [Methanoregula sp.]|uniref:hypothetical protein n=1 Tax=Methanoregula sp. TaxID=2052170 RepID=UPI002CE4F932|nr:hypothetical protein [Methanoregula sp.]HVP96067.1 hypothetical protein [Methanoregula sp.]
MAMPQDPHRHAIRLLSDQMIREGLGDYLLSEQFSRFCRKYDIYEIWTGLLGASLDRPDLYGPDILGNAVSLLLQHIYRGRNAEFPRILAGLLADYTKKPLNPLFVSTIKRDLIQLGYNEIDVDNTFSVKGL